MSSAEVKEEHLGHEPAEPAARTAGRDVLLPEALGTEPV